jgi:hypothetical protein
MVVTLKLLPFDTNIFNLRLCVRVTGSVSLNLNAAHRCAVVILKATSLPWF